MDLRAEISEFLRSRRARITPEQVGLGSGGRRRVAGLRREEVAVLASISVDWYVRIERGNLDGVSDEVLGALAVALRLSDAETTHLFDLARATGSPGSGSTRDARSSVTPSLDAVVNSMHGVAAWARNDRFDLLALNTLARGLFAEMLGSRIARGNIARFALLDPAARDFYRDWDAIADDVVAVLRGYVGARPHDRLLSNLVGELATGSSEFSRRWAAHEVKFHRTGRKRFHHGVVGDLDLDFQALAVPDDARLSVFVYLPADAASRERLQLLESWAATEEASGSPTDPAARPAGTARKG